MHHSPISSKRTTNNSCEESSMTILRINHVQLAMPRGLENVARRFYGEVRYARFRSHPHLPLEGEFGLSSVMPSST